MNEADIEISTEGQRLINRALYAVSDTKYDRFENHWWVEVGLIVILVTAAISLLTVVLTTLTVLGRIKDLSDKLLIVTLAVPSMGFLVPLFFYLLHRKFSSKAEHFARLADEIQEEMERAMNK